MQHAAIAAWLEDDSEISLPEVTLCPHVHGTRDLKTSYLHCTEAQSWSLANLTSRRNAVGKVWSAKSNLDRPLGRKRQDHRQIEVWSPREGPSRGVVRPRLGDMHRQWAKLASKILVESGNCRRISGNLYAQRLSISGEGALRSESWKM